MYQYLDEKQKKQLFAAVVGVLGFLAIFIGIKAINAIKDFSYIGKGIYPANVVTVNGTGEVTAVPDVASFSFSVTETSKQVADAQNNASKKMNGIIEALKAMSIDEKDIKTTGYNTYPKYDYQRSVCPPTSAPMMDLNSSSSYSYPCTEGKQVLTGYEVSQTITVKVRKMADAGAALSKVGGLGAQNISGLNFVIDDIEKVQAEARDKAIKNAKEKAAILAKSLGVKFSRITSFYENGAYPQAYGYGGDMMSAKVMSAEAVSVPQIPTGENKVVSNVSISYEVR